VTFGITGSLKSGKLTGLLLGAKVEATLQVTLTWKRPRTDADAETDG
jgi:hypothetical protein